MRRKRDEKTRFAKRKQGIQLNGLHLIGDLYECACERDLLVFAANPLKQVRSLCERSGLTVVGERAYEFEGGGYTLATLLAESHVTLHTWPELDRVAMDVYVCNHTQNNIEKARGLARELVELFLSSRPVIKEIERGEIGEPHVTLLA
ncbi:MAG: S-adenosylmethionine decarboxylase proenzyme [Burkholderiales bacterium]|nr:MAG: S-adenosylmethionine decarboxylase proenzyme [Burkholderiales bacterium]